MDSVDKIASIIAGGIVVILVAFLFMCFTTGAHEKRPSSIQELEKGEAPGYYYQIFHDQMRQVTCWKIGGDTLSCLPDKDLADGGR
jgi:hypothetical protein